MRKFVCILLYFTLDSWVNSLENSAGYHLPTLGIPTGTPRTPHGLNTFCRKHFTSFFDNISLYHPSLVLASCDIVCPFSQGRAGVKPHFTDRNLLTFYINLFCSCQVNELNTFKRNYQDNLDFPFICKPPTRMACNLRPFISYCLFQQSI